MVTKTDRRAASTVILGGIILLVCAGSGLTMADTPPLLVVLDETGEGDRHGLPVYRRHPASDEVEAVLLRGFSGRLLRQYRRLQTERAVRDGTPVEPAYLLLSGNQGGFPRFGFVLDGVAKPGAGYVDLHRNSNVAGAPGALDQIFPHELLHVIVRQLAGERRPGGSNQVHAVNVCTDPETAFEEGFAEHGQVMAIDAPDADPATRRWATDPSERAWAESKLQAYERALGARLAIAPKSRMAFILWFGRSEQILRYHGVKNNLFARARAVPDRLLRTSDPYAAYLLENIVPGRPGDSPKPIARRLATEGVVATLFVRWTQDPAFAESATDEDAGLDPLDHVYAKIFRAIEEKKPATTVQFLRAYRDLFPAESDAVDRVVADVLGPGSPPPSAIWLENGSFRTGTTVYDQFRGLPRSHTFDLNAASLVDLVSVPGVGLELARSIRSAAPFDSVGDVRHVPGMNDDVARTIEAMAATAVRTDAEDREEETTLELNLILLSYARRALAVFAFCALFGAILYRIVREARWWRAGLAGSAAALVALSLGWLLDPGHALLALAAPIVLFGTVGAAWRLREDRAWRPAVRVLAAWLAATLPSFIALRPWF